MEDNRYHNDPLAGQENLDEVEQKAAESRNFFRSLFAADTYSSQRAASLIPFLVFLAVLGILYIANRHMAEKNVRRIDALSRDVKVMSWEYKTLKAELMQRSTQTEVARRVDSMGLKELTEPPKKLVVERKGK